MTNWTASISHASYKETHKPGVGRERKTKASDGPWGAVTGGTQQVNPTIASPDSGFPQSSGEASPHPMELPVTLPTSSPQFPPPPPARMNSQQFPRPAGVLGARGLRFSALTGLPAFGCLVLRLLARPGTAPWEAHAKPEGWRGAPAALPTPSGSPGPCSALIAGHPAPAAPLFWRAPNAGLGSSSSLLGD